MATKPVGTIYPKARGPAVLVLNCVASDIIEAIVQLHFCDKNDPFPKNDHDQHAYVWTRVRDYCNKVIKHHKY